MNKTLLAYLIKFNITLVWTLCRYFKATQELQWSCDAHHKDTQTSQIYDHTLGQIEILMTALEDHQRLRDPSSGEYEFLWKMSRQSTERRCDLWSHAGSIRSPNWIVAKGEVKLLQSPVQIILGAITPEHLLPLWIIPATHSNGHLLNNWVFS